jgi:hypothetical protein
LTTNVTGASTLSFGTQSSSRRPARGS